MTTRKDVEEALHALECSHIEVDCYECREWVRDVNCDNILNQSQYLTIKQALQEKLDRFDTIGTVEYVQELEQMEKSDEE